MKLLILLTMLLAIRANAYDLTLKFSSKEEARQWVVWYLDGGGEQSADFYATDFNVQNLMTNEGQFNNNERPYIFLVEDKEMNYEWITRSNR